MAMRQLKGFYVCFDFFESLLPCRFYKLSVSFDQRVIQAIFMKRVLVGMLSFYPGASPLYASVVSLVLPIVVTQLVFSGGTFTGSMQTGRIGP